MFRLVVGLLLVFLILGAVAEWRRGGRSPLVEQPWLGGLVTGGAAALLLSLSFWAVALTTAGLLYLVRTPGRPRPQERGRQERGRRRRGRERRSALDEPGPVPMLGDGGQMTDVWARLRRLAPDSPNRIAAVERSCERFLKRAPAGTLDLATIEDAQLVRDRLPSLVDACERQVEAGGDRAVLADQLLDSIETIAAAAERATARIDATGREAWDRERDHVARRTARDDGLL